MSSGERLFESSANKHVGDNASGDYTQTEANDGPERSIAFGQLQEGGAFGRWFFVVLATGAAIAVLFYFFRTPRNDDRILGACALLLAGILGNLTDRIRLGFVIDFILLHAGQYHWPTFNVADASISIGALLLAYDLIFAHRKAREDSLTNQRVASGS